MYTVKEKKQYFKIILYMRNKDSDKQNNNNKKKNFQSMENTILLARMD